MPCEKYINVKETECNEINSLANTKKLTPNGKYFIRSAGDCEYVDGLGEHYDYECFGKDHIAREHGVFDEAGYVAYTGKIFFYSPKGQKERSLLSSFWLFEFYYTPTIDIEPFWLYTVKSCLHGQRRKTIYQNHPKAAVTS